jgi:hypothetical protein
MKRTCVENLIPLLACVAALLAVACADREHIRDDYGQRVRAFQSKQRAYARAATGTPTGLDSEEAAIIHKGYRSDLAGKGEGSGREGNRVLILGEPTHAGKQ